MSLTFKAFLYDRTWRGDPVEIRRFTVDQDVSSSYAYLLEKVVQVFPSLTTNNVILAWTDSDGDVVTISSDEELVEALDQFEGSIFHLYLKKRASIPAVCCGTAAPKPVTSDQSKQETPKGDAEGQEPPPDGPSPASHEKEGSFHPGVSCDGCNGPIYGTRFKCLVCRDYDLCSSCEGKGIHVDHNMISISDPWSYHPWGGFGWHTHAGFGPFHGRRGGCCRGRRFGDHHHGHHGDDHHGHRHGDGDRDHHDRRHHFGDHGFVPPWCFGFGKGGASCHGSEHKERSHGEGQEPMETEHRPGPSEEERKSFLRGVGEAVSNFLEPFGVKVDVDVVGGEKSADTKTTGDANDVAEVSDEVVEEALAQLRSMGYQDEGGWLKELVRAKKGDVTKVLDALHPTVEQD